MSTYALILAISIKQFYVSLPYENLRGYNAELIYNINQRDKSQHLTRSGYWAIKLTDKSSHLILFNTFFCACPLASDLPKTNFSAKLMRLSKDCRASEHSSLIFLFMARRTTEIYAISRKRGHV